MKKIARILPILLLGVCISLLVAQTFRSDRFVFDRQTYNYCAQSTQSISTGKRIGININNSWFVWISCPAQ